MFFKRQFGFRSKHSTKHSLITITETVRKSVDKGELTCGIFLDFQKAFDTVSHEILLSKLDHYGFRGLTNEWIKSYLRNRKQFVYHDGCESSLKCINQGVPQGSVLGPLLFLIYINDIENDTAILYSDKSPKRIQKRLNIDLKLLLKWLKSNRISLNVKKTEAVLFKTLNKKLNFNLKIKLDGKRLSLSPSAKYLGTFIDENLSLSKHQEYISNKLRRSNGILSTLRNFLPMNILRSMYFAIFHSHLEYAIEIWGLNISKHSRIYKLQKSAVRIMTFSDQRTHSPPIFQMLDIPPLPLFIISKNIQLVHQTLNNNVPEAVQDILDLRYTTNPFGTRSESNKLLSKPLVRTTKFGIKSIKYQAVVNWNALQNNFKGIDLASSRLTKVNKLIKIVK